MMKKVKFELRSWVLGYEGSCLLNFGFVHGGGERGGRGEGGW